MNERPINNGRGLFTESHPALMKMSGANGGFKRQLEARDVKLLSRCQGRN